MNQQEPDFTFERMTHALGLDHGLVHIDGNIAGKSGRAVIPERNDVGRTVHSPETSVQGLDPFVAGDLHGQLDGYANFLRGEYVRSQMLQILAGISL